MMKNGALLLFAAGPALRQTKMSASAGDRWNDVLNCVDVKEKHSWTERNVSKRATDSASVSESLSRSRSNLS